MGNILLAIVCILSNAAFANPMDSALKAKCYGQFGEKMSDTKDILIKAKDVLAEERSKNENELAFRLCENKNTDYTYTDEYKKAELDLQQAQEAVARVESQIAECLGIF